MLFLSGCREKEASESNAQPLKVQTAQLEKRLFSRKICAHATIQPIDRAAIAAKVNGTIDVLNVREGHKVKKDDILFQTDRKNLENQLLVARQNLRVSEATVRTSEDDVTIAQTTLDKATYDYKRMQTLLQSNAVSQTAFEQAEADWKRATASYNRALTVLSYNQVKVEQAKTILDITEKNLADSIIRAPYDGVITKKSHDLGEYVSAGMEILEIECQSALEASSLISSLYYPLVSMDTNVLLYSGGKKLCQAKLSYISPSIDPMSRTFEIKMNLPRQENLISGSLCDAEIILESRNNDGISSNAVIARSGGKNSVFVAENGKAVEIPVRIGLTTDNYTEILNAEALTGKKIVVAGQYFLNDGTPVEIIQGEQK
jgi:RND family efflux transporter MFP subunit